MIDHGSATADPGDPWASFPADPAPLSPAGEARKRAILASLEGRLQNRHRARAAGRISVMAAAIGAITTATWLTVRAPAPHPAPVRIAEHPRPPLPYPAPDAPSHATPQPSGANAVRIVSIATERGIADRLATSGHSAARVQLMDDDELVEALAQTGRSCGLVRTGGRVLVIANSAPDRGLPGVFPAPADLQPRPVPVPPPGI